MITKKDNGEWNTNTGQFKTNTIETVTKKACNKYIHQAKTHGNFCAWFPIGK